ncbi:hypothetical protein DCS_04469 [Drechmeria coniospora]|uniref:MARVEL domain-containing protein n=1 Tax=Drechmeria coniospora TaxID=98403 RepID=A0A151GK32_DRECN|nr:hypothetical protein DCS_04469 [Drechmeria coniospora]KYK57460.1 hypothetical protein DCS_04469 [Drechmeria coniospora]
MSTAPAPGALGLTFTAMRAMQAVALITIIGLTSNFISELETAQYEAPSALVGTLVVSCLAAVYVTINYILYWDSMLPLLISAGADILCLVAFIVVACVIGKPVSYLSCSRFSDDGKMAWYIQSLFPNLGRKDRYFTWVDSPKASCLKMKSIWGLSICLCILFLVSSVVSACLWKRIKGACSRPGPKDIE